jgi:Domain of unknown function (DUF4388)
MSTRYAIFTERLVHILPGIALQQQTGRLSIENVGEQQREKGEIFFVHGDTVFAHTEHESGEAALYQMMNWREVHYSFFEGVRAPAGVHQRNRIVRRPRQTRPLLPIELEQTRPMAAVHIPAGPLEPEATGSTPAVGMPVIPKSARPSPITPGYLSPRQDSHHGSLPSSRTGCPTSLHSHLYSLPASIDPALHDFATPLPSPRPQLVESAAEMSQYGAFAVFRALPLATRQHVINSMERRVRVVFLLLDGRRTLRDVARLVHRSEWDIAHNIAHLLKQGYIEYTAV